MSDLIYLISMFMLLGTILLVFGMRYYAWLKQAKASLAQGDAYRKIAEQATEAQTASAAALGAIRSDLADVRSRLAAVENILREVG